MVISTARGQVSWIGLLRGESQEAAPHYGRGLEKREKSFSTGSTPALPKPAPPAR